MATPRLLSKQLRPENYALTLRISDDATTFSGSVVITAKKLKPSKRITLHAKDLIIDEAQIVRHDRKQEHEMPVTRINYQKRFNEVRLHTENNLYPGEYTITLHFHGVITKTMVGIYPSYLKDESGKTDVIIGTQFESHHAREAFPCIDEPAAKASVALTLDVANSDDLVALSNMPVASEDILDERRIVRFETTPIMSTYLVAFVYGKMHCIEAKTNSGITVRSWASTTRPKQQLQYSVDEAVSLLEFYEEYYGTPYPLPKLDQVALPDFDAGAMENWGLVTYREIALLADMENRSISQEQYVSMVVAHELAHQWFGNLVTMKWWDDLWLNESFASLMEHLSLDVIHPDWMQWESYTASDVLSTTSRDIYSDIQPVGVKVVDVSLLETLFDPGIVYAKGGRLLKMLREFISDKDFAKALQIYFSRHQYSNTTREDLWTAMTQVADQDISALMTPWLVKPGLPVLRVKQDGKTIELSQKRYVLDADDSESIWPIPLLTDRPLSRHLLKKQTDLVSSKTDEFVLFNQYGSGHYISQYVNQEHRDALARRMQDGNMPTESRINILNDMLLLARRGDSSLVDPLALVVQLKNEDRDSVWGLISRTIGAANQLTEGDDSAEALLRNIRAELATGWYRKLGWDDQNADDANTKQLRHTALSFMISSEDASAIAEAKHRYKLAKSLNDINAELRGTILATVARHGNKEDVLALLDQYQGASPDIQLDITSALLSTKSPEIGKEILQKAVGPKGFVRDQDIMRWVAIGMRNHHIRSVAWQHLVDNYAWLDKTLGESKAYDFLPVYCSGVITTKAWQKRYTDFFEPLKSKKSLEKNILIGLADIASRVAWRDRDEAKIKKFLLEYDRGSK